MASFTRVESSTPWSPPRAPPSPLFPSRGSWPSPLPRIVVLQKDLLLPEELAGVETAPLEEHLPSEDRHLPREQPVQLADAGAGERLDTWLTFEYRAAPPAFQ